MKREYLSFMCCPECRSDLVLSGEEDDKSIIKVGVLQCKNKRCGISYPIINAVPRFVSDGQYASSFGPQWRTFAKTQLDGSHTKDSLVRWETEVGWGADDLSGKRIIEFGSGAGRFVDVVSRLGAKLVIGIDITDAVDASQSNLYSKGNCFFIQADFFRLPIRPGSMDFGYSIGVLHHTPKPEVAFHSLVSAVNDNGSVALSLYDISFYRRPNRNSLKVATLELFWSINSWRCEFFRLFTTRMPSRVFLAYCKFVVPILHYLNKVPFLRFLRYFMPVTCYQNMPMEWSMVDTHDTYATKIVHQYRAKDIFQWFLRAKLYNIVVMNGRAGWVSLVATKNGLPSLQHEKYIHMQPLAPGIEGVFDQDGMS